MALVAYEYSDESDNDPEEETSEQTISSSEKTVLSASTRLSVSDLNDEEIDVITTVRRPVTVEDSDSDDDNDPVPVSFSNLPKPNYHTFNVVDIKSKPTKLSNLNKLLHPQSSNKTITDTGKKKLNFAKKDSGLLAVLPTPKQEAPTTLFKLTETSKPINPPKSLIPQSIKNARIASKIEQIEKLSKEATDGDDEIGVDFFSLSKVEDIEPLDVDLLELEIDEHRLDKKKNLINTENENRGSNLLVRKNGNIDVFKDEENPESDTTRSHLNLDEDAMHMLCGRKRKGQPHDDIEVIDIHEDKILAKNKELLAKHLTDESVQPTRKRSGGFSSLSKRKHQITYLAFQAKEREIELKNQWANNRFTKRQTQQKYGF